MTESDSPAANPTPVENQALPLEELELTPQWVKSSGKSYADHSGGEREPRREGRRPGRDRNREPDRERRPRPERPAGAGDRRGPRPERRPAGPPREHVTDHPPKPAKPPAEFLEVMFQPEEKGFAAMIEAMKQTQRAYALFDVAKLVLNKPERHHVKLSRKPAADGTRAPLFLVLPGENVFLRQEDALRFALRHHAAMIFKEKKTSIDPPKGNFTFVNRCGITGVWLGPPNYHEYQSRLIRHHQQRLRQIPFDEFQARIQTVKDPAAVKGWLDSMSAKMEYECLLDAEPKSFASRDDLERHFIENHVAQFVTAAPELLISGVASRQLQNPLILDAVRLAWMEERKFPMKTVNGMRGRFRHEGFHFFKDPKGITYLSRIKPQRFESITHLSERIQKIIVHLREHFGRKRKQLIEHFLPPTPVMAGTVETPAGADTPPPASTPEPGATTPPPASTPEPGATTPPPAPAPEPGATTPPPVRSSSEQDHLLADLHWLIRDGYVVEFSDGRLWALPDRPPPPPPKPAPATTVVASEDGAGPPSAAEPPGTAAAPTVETAPDAAAPEVAPPSNEPPAGDS